MVIVMGSLILDGVSMVVIMAYVWGFAIEMTKLANCEDVSLRRCEMMYEPSLVEMSVGGAFAYYHAMLLVDER